MTETPNAGPEQPRDPRIPDPQAAQHPQPSPLPSHPAAAGRQPYAGPEWRRPDAGSTQPASAGAGRTDEPGSAAPDPGAPPGSAPWSAIGRQPGAAHPDPGWQPAGGAGPAAAGSWGGGVASGAGPQDARPESGALPPGSPWPYAAPAGPGSAVPTGQPGRGGRRLIAVAAITAVLGGLVGGGAVAALDSGGGTTVTSAAVTTQTGDAPTSAAGNGTVEAAAATATRSVVRLDVRASSGEATGSGVIIRSDGYILTNEHVVAGAGSNGSITVTFDDGRTATATVVGTDATTDLAVVKVSGVSGLTAATFADSDTVDVGQTVLAIGSPLGLDGTVTEGIVSALHRPTRGGSNDTAVIDALQTDAAINSGNSGGPLVDLAGRVVGINTSIATAGSGGPGQSGSSGNIGIGFAIPADTAATIAEQLIADGTATHAYLGVQTGGGASSASSSDSGATLASVESGGPAAAAGLRTGDVVTKVDERVISDSDELVAAVRSYAPGEKVTLTVERDGAERTVTVTLGSDEKQ